MIQARTTEEQESVEHGEAAEQDMTFVRSRQVDIAVVRACHALSAETELAGLTARLHAVLSELTGASAIWIGLWQGLSQGWCLSRGAATESLSLAEARKRSLLPASAFDYAELSRAPLVVADATRDERFAHDSALTGLKHCSLLAVPVTKAGSLCALLLLEDRERPDALTAHAQAVSLLAAQLVICLEQLERTQEIVRQLEQRTCALRAMEIDLASSARRASVAEIATNVLHNVGNVLNSINVSAGVITERVRGSKAAGLSKAVQLMSEHTADLSSFLTSDARGQQLPLYLQKLALALSEEQRTILGELNLLTNSIDHIKDIVATQQSYAGSSGTVEPARVADLIEDALRINAGALARHEVAVVKDLADVPMVALDRHRVLQILINLISNAKYAMDDVAGRVHQIRIRVDPADGGTLRVHVIDNGEGIPPENLARIFTHGFTTRKEGHGFGLHSCRLAAQAMGGRLSVHSAGRDQGATFTLEVPIRAVTSPGST